MRLSFRAQYFFIFSVILLMEVWIALYVTDQFVRPFVGDVLIVVLMYAFVRTIFEIGNPQLLAVGILLFAYLVEVGQYFELVSRLGLAESKIAAIVIGTSFDWRDILAYTAGFGLILLGERAYFEYPTSTDPSSNG
jgi:hypothetical protein